MIAERLADLEQRLLAERHRLADCLAAVRDARRRVAQLEGAVSILRELCDLATRANGPSPDAPDA